MLPQDLAGCGIGGIGDVRDFTVPHAQILHHFVDIGLVDEVSAMSARVLHELLRSNISLIDFVHHRFTRIDEVVSGYEPIDDLADHLGLRRLNVLLQEQLLDEFGVLLGFPDYHVHHPKIHSELLGHRFEFPVLDQNSVNDIQPLMLGQAPIFPL